MATARPGEEESERLNFPATEGGAYVPSPTAPAMRTALGKAVPMTRSRGSPPLPEMSTNSIELG